MAYPLSPWRRKWNTLKETAAGVLSDKLAGESFKIQPHYHLITVLRLCARALNGFFFLQAVHIGPSGRLYEALHSDELQGQFSTQTGNAIRSNR